MAVILRDRRDTPRPLILGGGYHSIPLDLDGVLTSTVRPHQEPGDPAAVALVRPILLGWTIDQYSLSTSWVGAAVLLSTRGERGFQATNTADPAKEPRLG